MTRITNFYYYLIYLYVLDEAGEEVLPAEGNPDRDLWKINCWSLSEQVLVSHPKRHPLKRITCEKGFFCEWLNS